MQELLTGKRRLPGFAKSNEYKQTEVGVIPEDWEIRKVGDISEVQTGSTPPTSNKAYYHGPHFFIGPGDLGESVFIRRAEKTLSEAGFARSPSHPSIPNKKPSPRSWPTWIQIQIEALEQKRDKYKQIKQGMMEQLLTGKVRLV
jgi:hypothetical protein